MAILSVVKPQNRRYILELSEQERLYLLNLVWRSSSYCGLFDTIKGDLDNKILKRLPGEGNIYLTLGEWDEIGKIANEI